MSVKWKGMYSK